ncbi:MAG: hypothetical protein AB7O57_02175 [Hyphomicrobiaceae bacterium]
MTDTIKTDANDAIRNLDIAEIDRVAGAAGLSIIDDWCGTGRPRFPFPFPGPWLPGPTFPRGPVFQL